MHLKKLQKYTKQTDKNAPVNFMSVAILLGTSQQ